jgi:hypothetical protein
MMPYASRSGGSLVWAELALNNPVCVVRLAGMYFAQ